MVTGFRSVPSPRSDAICISSALPILVSSSPVHSVIGVSPSPHRHQRLDRAALVHGSVRLGDAIEVGLEVKDAPGMDAAFEDVVEELRNVPGTGAEPPRNPMLRANMVSIGTSTPWGTPTKPTV